MKQILIPKRGDLMVLSIGFFLLTSAALPAVLLVDYVQILNALPALAGFTFWSPLVIAILAISYACLLTWTAFSQSHWLKRLPVFAVLLGAGLTMMWLSASLTHVIDASRIFFQEPVLSFVLIGMAGLPALLAMKYLLGIQLVHGVQAGWPPNLKLFLIGAAVLMVPAFMISTLAQQTRDANMETAAMIIVAGALAVGCLIGIPVWILSRNWRRRLRGTALAVYLLVLCSIPIAASIAIERDQNIWLGGLFWGSVCAAVALCTTFLSAILVGRFNGIELLPCHAKGAAGKLTINTKS